MEVTITSCVPDESHATPDENDENLSQIIIEVTPCQLDLSKSYPTDRGNFCEDLHDADLKKSFYSMGHVDQVVHSILKRRWVCLFKF